MTMVERAGHAARIAAQGLSVSTYGQPKLNGKHIVYRGSFDVPIFTGTFDECVAHMNNIVGRAAIEAMREPTTPVREAVMTYCEGDNAIEASEGAKAAWRCAIDAALSEGDGKR